MIDYMLILFTRDPLKNLNVSYMLTNCNFS